MVSKRTKVPAALLALLPACHQAGVQNGAPRLSSSVPDQTAAGGTAFTLDLAPFVVDRETPPAALVYTVLAGGGSCTGSVYSHTFDTLGTYEVAVRVADPAGEWVDVEFVVAVPTANVGVITAGSDLHLLDTDTLHQRTLASSGGFTITFKAALAKGFIAYERQAGSDRDLYLYDASTTATVTLGDDRSIAERFAGLAGPDRVLFTAQGDTGKALKMHDVTRGETVVIAAADGESAGDPVVDAAGRVYYELTANGQNDIWVYDPTTNLSSAVSTDARGEETVAALADGALVFTRRGDAAETDLFWFRRDVGIVEVGGDLPGLANLSKSFGGANATGVVAFTANNAGQLDFYLWNSAVGITAAVGTTADNESFAAVLPDGNVVYYVLTGGTDLDLRLFDVTAAVSRAFPASAVLDLVVGTLSDSRVVVSKAEATGVHLYLATHAAGTVTEAPLATTSGQSFVLEKVLANDKIVVRNVTSGGVSLVTPGGGTVAFGPMSAFVQAMPTSGDFVVKDDNGGQFDLTLWDDSAGTEIALANGTTDEELAQGLADGRILFTREVAGSNVRNLFVWSPVGPTVTQVTDDGVDHVVQATFAVDAR
jgi:hypothetical protein